MKKRIITVLLAVFMAVGMLPAVAFAAEGLSQDSDGYYLIGNTDELFAFAEMVNGGQTTVNGRLTADITVNAQVLNQDGTLVSDTSSLTAWIPIGNKSTTYGGIFDGAGFTISGLYLDKYGTTSSDNYDNTYIGFFGHASKATIKNLTIRDSFFGGYEHVGAIAGRFVGNGSRMVNCVSYATVKGKSYVGGISGELQKAAVTNCHNHGLVMGCNYTGGFAGCTSYNAAYYSCSNTGDIQWIDCGKKHAGEFAGFVTKVNSQDPVCFTNCFNTGNITYGANNTYEHKIGGFIAIPYTGVFENCYAACSITVKNVGDKYKIGSFVAVKETRTQPYKNCYYDSAVSSYGAENNDANDYILPMTSEQFASGEVTYKLNGSTSEGELAWYQTIGRQSTPQFSGKVVFHDKSADPQYFNEKDTATVTWLVDGQQYHSEDLEIGAVITVPENPTKESVNCVGYIFEKWTPEIPEVMPAEGLDFNAVFTEREAHSFADGTCSGCGAEDPEAEPLVYVAYYSLSLKGDIGVNYYMYIDETVAADPNGYMQFTTPRGGQVKIPITQAEQKTVGGKLYYVFTATVAAKEMMDTIQGQYFYGESSSAVYPYTVKQYADIIIANEQNNPEFAKFKPVAEAMLVYGAWAQKNFNYNTGSLPAEVSQLTDITAETLAAFAKAQQGTANVKLYGATLTFETETVMRLFFNCPAEQLSVTMGGQPLQVTQDESGLCYVAITDIAAKDLDTEYTVTINDGTETADIRYCPLSVCYNILKAEAGTYTNELINTVKAFYLYNQAANVYFS